MPTAPKPVFEFSVRSLMLGVFCAAFCLAWLRFFNGEEGYVVWCFLHPWILLASIVLISAYFHLRTDHGRDFACNMVAIAWLIVAAQVLYHAALTGCSGHVGWHQHVKRCTVFCSAIRSVVAIAFHAAAHIHPCRPLAIHAPWCHAMDFHGTGSRRPRCCGVSGALS